MFSSSIEGEFELIAMWNRVTLAVREGAERGVIQAVLKGVNEAQMRHRFQNRTGKLEASITDKILGWNGDTYAGSISARKKYASYVEPTHPFMSLAYLKAEAVLQREVELGIDRAQAIVG
jgi:hypothetical protein